MPTELADWFLTDAERANDATDLPSWRDGNHCTPLVHGVEYFRRLAECVGRAGDGDQVFFTDWRGDPDQKLTADGPTVAEMFEAAAHRGACVRGLVWRSHIDALQFSAHENRSLDREITAAGGQVILDQRVRRMGSHHQKLVVVRCPGHPEHDVAFVGGIDLCHSRRDDDQHAGDPQPLRMSKAYGPNPPWHDVQLEIRGPAVADVETVFRERWDNPTNADEDNPIARVLDRIRGARLTPSTLPPQASPPPDVGRMRVQLLRTYPKIRPPYPYAPDGERSIARGYAKVVGEARRLVYLEDQYLWSTDVGDLLADALEQQPLLHVVAVLPRHPDQDGAFADRPYRLGRYDALRRARAVGGDRLHLYDLENSAGTPIYVHAKVCIVDDVWVTVGSDNLNRRSWSHDSELNAAVVDEERDPREPTDPRGDGAGVRVLARNLRLRLVREHLGRSDDSVDDLVDAVECVGALDAAADALDDWHRDGRRGPRPPGHVRRHHDARPSTFTRLWATPVYRWVHDPDGRPLRVRRRGGY